MIKIQELNPGVIINDTVFPLNTLILQSSGNKIRILTSSLQEVVPFTNFTDFVLPEGTSSVDKALNEISKLIYN